MCFNSLYQYSWNALAPLISGGLEANHVQIALAFSLFNAISSLSQPAGGFLADRSGPKSIGLIQNSSRPWGFPRHFLLSKIYLFSIPLAP